MRSEESVAENVGKTKRAAEIVTTRGAHLIAYPLRVELVDHAWPVVRLVVAVAQLTEVPHTCGAKIKAYIIRLEHISPGSA